MVPWLPQCPEWFKNLSFLRALWLWGGARSLLLPGPVGWDEHACCIFRAHVLLGGKGSSVHCVSDHFLHLPSESSRDLGSCELASEAWWQGGSWGERSQQASEWREWPGRVRGLGRSGQYGVLIHSTLSCSGAARPKGSWGAARVRQSRGKGSAGASVCLNRVGVDMGLPCNSISRGPRGWPGSRALPLRASKASCGSRLLLEG